MSTHQLFRFESVRQASVLLPQVRISRSSKSLGKLCACAYDSGCRSVGTIACANRIGGLSTVCARQSMDGPDPRFAQNISIWLSVLSRGSVCPFQCSRELGNALFSTCAHYN